MLRVDVDEKMVREMMQQAIQEWQSSTAAGMSINPLENAEQVAIQIRVTNHKMTFVKKKSESCQKIEKSFF